MSEQTPTPLQRTAAVASLSAVALSGFAAGAEQLGNDQLPRPQAAHELILPKTPVDHLLPPHVEATNPVHPAHPYIKTTPVSIHTEVRHQPTRQPIVERHHRKPVVNIPTTVPKRPTEKPPAQLLDLHPENLTVSDAVQESMRANTVYLPWAGCSGSLIRNQAGEAIGVLTAEHCGLRDGDDSSPYAKYFHHRVQGSDGQSYLALNTEPVVEVGDNLQSLQPAGKLKQVIVPPKGDTSLDVALGVLDGHTADEVLQAYNANRLSDQDIQNLKLGQDIYLSGWPTYQPNNTGSMERQSFHLAVLGVENVTVTSGETMPMLLAAVPRDKDGATCSFGDSGGEGFIEEAHTDSNGLPYTIRHTVGTLSAFMDHGGDIYWSKQVANENTSYYEHKYGAKLSYQGTDGQIHNMDICGFAYQPPQPGTNGEVVNLVSSHAEIPGYSGELTPWDEIVKARDAFNDPNYTRTVIDGSVYIPSGKGPAFWLDNPALYVDASSGAAILESANLVDASHLALYYFDKLSDIELYKHSGDEAPTVLQSTGIPEFQTDANYPSGYFVDQSGLHYGIELDAGEPAHDGTVYTLTMGKGDVPYATVKSVELTPAEQKFHADFFDSSLQRHKIDGIVQVMTPEGPYWISNPAYEYDATSNTLLIGLGSLKGSGDGLTVISLPADD
ncbi:MAG TPA: hypothetical protein VFI84_01600, partial [Candidatus Saccharimonadales bacterium]|nr:hypothetical protein [Candidatus Saccharimonadales bacterium]